MTDMTIFYVALIRKMNLQCADNKDIYDIAFVKARTRDQAVEKIINMDWPEEWYVKGKSKTVLIQIWQFSEAISGKIPKMARDAAEMQEFNALKAFNEGKAIKPPRRRRKTPETAPKRPEKAAKPRRRVRKL